MRSVDYHPIVLKSSEECRQVVLKILLWLLNVCEGYKALCEAVSENCAILGNLRDNN